MTLILDPTPAATPRPPAETLSLATPGPILFARFAFPPNRLGLCGPASGDALAEHVRDERVDPDLVRMAREFEGAYPYLELIAGSNAIADPLDSRVVEAYWVGNDLLGGVTPRAHHADLERRFKGRASRRDWPWLEAKAGSDALVHHSFHVLEVLPRIGTLRGELPPALVGALERCLVRPARIVASGGGTIEIAVPPLELRDGQLRLGTAHIERLEEPADGGYGDRLVPGDAVAVHWERVCGRLSPAQASSLLSVTARNIAVANTTI
jgi:hypothetical protein